MVYIHVPWGENTFSALHQIGMRRSKADSAMSRLLKTLGAFSIGSY